ncbi:hypothetical protein AB0M20_18730 [Actinoplanes sp. NPDC051633]|uniref:hypothetical protein n=1 Tax=Actinoplanes sp. NPDC051633 TaxID=3155670 RepID=UPI003430C95E
MPRVLAFLGWIPIGLVLPLVLVDGISSEGYPVGLLDMGPAAGGVAAGAGLGLGLLYGRRMRWVVLLTEVAFVAAGFLILHAFLYRVFVPAIGDQQYWPGVAYAVAGAAAGIGLGRLRPARTPSPPAPGLFAVALAVAIAGILVTANFVSIAAELATTGIGADSRSSPARLPAGRHAVFAPWGTGDCDVTADGKPVSVHKPRIRLTDNSDSIVTVFIGTFDLERPATVAASCQNAGLGDPPVTAEPMRTLIYEIPWLTWLYGILSGALTALGIRLARRAGRTHRAPHKSGSPDAHPARG